MNYVKKIINIFSSNKNKNYLDEEYIIINLDKKTMSTFTEDTDGCLACYFDRAMFNEYKSYNEELDQVIPACYNKINSNCFNYFYDISIYNIQNIIIWFSMYYFALFLLKKYNSTYSVQFSNVYNYADLLCASFNTLYFIYTKNVYFLIAYYFYDLLRMGIYKEKDYFMVFHHLITLIGLIICPSNSCYDLIINNTIAVKVNDIFLYNRKLIENSPLNKYYPRLSSVLIVGLTSYTAFNWITFRTYNLLTFIVPSKLYTYLQYGLLSLTIGYSYIMLKSLKSSFKKMIALF